MLRVKNNNVYMMRGEEARFTVNVFTKDGVPYIPPAGIPLSTGTLIDNQYYEDGKLVILIDSSMFYENEGLTIGFCNFVDSITYIYDDGTEQNFSGPMITCSFSPVNTSATKQTIGIKIPEAASIEYMNTGGKSYLPDVTKPILAFSVGANGVLIFAKYLDMQSPPMYDGRTDYSPGGFTKFTSQTPIEITSALDIDTYNADVENGEVYVYHYVAEDGTDVYQTGAIDYSGEVIIVPYAFSVSIPITTDDTLPLEVKTYRYDVNFYISFIKADELFDISYKRNLVRPHDFVLEETTNA